MVRRTMLDSRRNVVLACMLSALVKVGQLVTAALTGGARWGWAPNLLLWAATVAGSLRGSPITGSISPRSGLPRARRRP